MATASFTDDSSDKQNNFCSDIGLTDLEQAYRDILDQPISPTSVGGMKSFAKVFKKWESISDNKF